MLTLSSVRAWSMLVSLSHIVLTSIAVKIFRTDVNSELFDVRAGDRIAVVLARYIYILRKSVR